MTILMIKLTMIKPGESCLMVCSTVVSFRHRFHKPPPTMPASDDDDDDEEEDDGDDDDGNDNCWSNSSIMTIMMTMMRLRMTMTQVSQATITMPASDEDEILSLTSVKIG